MQQIPGQPGLHSKKNVKDKQTNKKKEFNSCMKIKELLQRKKNQLSEKATEWGELSLDTHSSFKRLKYRRYTHMRAHTHTHTLQTNKQLNQYTGNQSVLKQ